MGIERIASEEEKIQFLKIILQLAKENPGLIPKEGKAIFYEDFPAFGENCIIDIHLDEKKRPYFKIKGSFEVNADKVYTPEQLLIEGKKYFSKYLDKFKRNFFFHESTDDNSPDLLANLKE
ncbi:MAG: hypothetical protein ACP5NZ_03515 [Nanobdellota archaeon]